MIPKPVPNSEHGTTSPGERVDSRWGVLAVLTGARTAMGFQLQVVGSTASALKPAFGIDNAEIGFLVGLFLLPGIIVALPSGLLGNRFGDRRIVLVGLAVMALGGAVLAMADSYPQAILARVCAGIGAVLSTVLLSKIIADRFMGKEIVLAMAIMLNSFPIGIALGQFVFPMIAQAAGWQAAVWLAAIAAAGAFVLVLIGYSEPRHVKAAGSASRFGLGDVTRSELLPVCLLGITWAVLNGAIVTVAGFAPTLLEERGHPTARSAILLALTTALCVVSVQSGGWLGQHLVKPRLLAWLGSLLFGAGVCLATLPGLEIIGLALAYLCGGSGAGAIYALAGSYLRPQNRAIGFGVFLTWLYLGFALLPIVAGMIARLSGTVTTALLFCGVLLMASALCVIALRMFPVPATNSR